MSQELAQNKTRVQVKTGKQIIYTIFQGIVENGLKKCGEMIVELGGGGVCSGEGSAQGNGASARVASYPTGKGSKTGTRPTLVLVP